MVNSPTLDPDLLAMLAEIDAGEMPPGAFADYLDEQGENAPWVKCPVCKGTGEGIKLNGSGSAWKPCVCGGTGEVQDRDLADRAEYIRAGVECKCRWQGTALAAHVMVLKKCRNCSRRAALLAANSASWCAMPCPGCKGRGWNYRPGSTTHRDSDTCSTCGGSGDLFSGYSGTTIHPGPPAPGQNISRIDPARDFYAGGIVPYPKQVATELGGVGREVVAYRAKNRPYSTSDGAAMVFDPSDWALAIARHCPSVMGWRVTDVTAQECGGGWMLCREQPNVQRVWYAVPGVIYDVMESQAMAGWLHRNGPVRSVLYPTPAAAHRALSQSMMTLVRGAPS